MMFRFLVVASLATCYNSVNAFVPQRATFYNNNNVGIISTERSMVTSMSNTAEDTAMPEQLGEWGCDQSLWDAVPPGAKRDLRRFVRTEKEELARNRLATMREILTFVDGSTTSAEEGGEYKPWEESVWKAGVIAWEADNLAKIEAEKARIKAEKKAKIAAKAKAQREAKAKKEAEEKAAAEAAAATAEKKSDDDFQ